MGRLERSALDALGGLRAARRGRAAAAASARRPLRRGRRHRLGRRRVRADRRRGRRELDDAELEELFAVGSRTWSLAFRGREEQRLDAPPHALLGGALDDGFVTHVHEEKGRADAGAEGV